MLGVLVSSMSEKREKARLEVYVEELSDNPEGMGLEVQNVEGGGSNVPDESREYESRLEWLQDTQGGRRDGVWRELAEQDPNNVTVEEDEELVYIECPGWFVNDDEDLSPLFNVTDGQTVSTFAVLRKETSEDKAAFAFKAFNQSGMRWVKPRNQYKTAWIPKKLCTLYIKTGDPRPVDKERVNERDALPEEIDRFEAEEDDYEWKLALGAAYRRCIDEEKSSLEEAYKEAQELPQKLYEKVECGVDEYMRECSAENKEVDEDDLAMVVKSLTHALTPGVRTEYEEDEEE